MFSWPKIASCMSWTAPNKRTAALPSPAQGSVWPVIAISLQSCLSWTLFTHSGNPCLSRWEIEPMKVCLLLHFNAGTLGVQADFQLLQQIMYWWEQAKLWYEQPWSLWYAEGICSVFRVNFICFMPFLSPFFASSAVIDKQFSTTSSSIVISAMWFWKCTGIVVNKRQALKAEFAMVYTVFKTVFLSFSSMCWYVSFVASRLLWRVYPVQAKGPRYQLGDFMIKPGIISLGPSAHSIVIEVCAGDHHFSALVCCVCTTLPFTATLLDFKCMEFLT